MRRFANCLQIVIVKENTDAKMLRGSQRRTKIKSVKNTGKKCIKEAQMSHQFYETSELIHIL